MADKRDSIYAILDTRVLGITAKLASAKMASRLGRRFVPRYSVNGRHAIIQIKPTCGLRFIKWAVSTLPESGIQVGTIQWLRRTIGRNEETAKYWGLERV
jgi:hypothetical protein